jgi:hypothetical protein
MSNNESTDNVVLWSLGTTLAHKKNCLIEIVVRAKKRCWDKAIVRIDDFSSRAIAYALKGLFNYYSIYKEKRK